MTPPPHPSSLAPILCVDLDRTLAGSDLSTELVLRAIRRHPWITLLLPFWRLRGKAYFQAQIAQRIGIDAALIPYREDVLRLVRQARSQGRETWLITAIHSRFAAAVCEHLVLFNGVISSTESSNLDDGRKLRTLDERFGKGRYEYLRNPPEDPSAANPGMNAWLRAIRIHQWAKNALLFVPLVTAHRLLDMPALVSVSAAFVAMGLCASATYIFNDLFDLDADRQHPTKRHRPFAAGVLKARTGVMTAAAMLAIGALIAHRLPIGFQVALAIYLVVTVLYSLRLKRIASLDVLLLAGLYTLRVIAGAWAAGVDLSFWLLAFSMFIFLCLALVKRVAELIEVRDRHGAENSAPSKRLIGREYGVEDIPILQVMGATSGYLAVLVLALYINSPDVARLYETPEILWLIAPLMLLWVTRLWIVTTRGYMHDDPILFAIKDPETWITAAIVAVILVCATVVEL